MKENLVYIDGNFFKKSDAKISVFDHGLLYGDGVFEGIRVYGDHIFKLEEHLKRLYESAKSISLIIPLEYNGLKKAVFETLEKNDLKDAYIRIIVTRGIGTLGLNPILCPKATIIIITDYLAPLFENRNAKAIIASTRRNATAALNPNIKSLNYLNNILARIEANRSNVDEAIMLNQNGTVSEGTGDNIFIIKNTKMITPPPSAGILVGITRNLVIELAQQEGIDVEEREITVHELYNADEVFLTGTAAEIAPLVKIDDIIIGNGEVGKITKTLVGKFKKIVIFE